MLWNNDDIELPALKLHRKVSFYHGVCVCFREVCSYLVW